MIGVRKPTIKERDSIKHWFELSDGGNCRYKEGMIPWETTFVCTVDNVLAVSVSILELKNTTTVWIDFLLGNPEMDADKRRPATKTLFTFIENYCTGKGYERAVGFSPNDNLSKYYESFGGVKTMAVTAMIKELKCHQQYSQQ